MTSMTIGIRGGELVEPGGRRHAELLISEGRIVDVGEGVGDGADLVLDASGCLVASGLVDLHTHMREPGREDAETVHTAALGAARGGFTTVCAMPNTTPAIDSPALVRDILRLAESAPCRVLPVGAITKGRAGRELAPMGEMAELGVTMFTDDGTGVADNALMRRAMEYASGLGVTLAQHCEDPALAGGGAMHEGEWSARLGIPGQPAEAEELMVMRDIALSRLTGARIHFQHLSTAGSVDMVRRARRAGVAVTAEATTHHFTLTHAECRTFDPVFKVHPPLRTSEDVAAVRAGLADGTIDAIATDHAPHTPETKDLPFDQAPPGMLGLETALALALTELDLPVERVFDLMSWTPARIAGLAGHDGSLRVGAPADICVVDPGQSWTVSGRAMASRSRNTPYEGRTLTGRVRHTVYAGRAVVVDGGDGP